MAGISVLGCGRIVRMHADSLAAHPRAKLAGVFDIDAPFAEEVAARHNVENFATAGEAIASDKADGVLIATPADTHVEFFEASVNAGKPVLCEKPINPSLPRRPLAAQTSQARAGRATARGLTTISRQGLRRSCSEVRE